MAKIVHNVCTGLCKSIQTCAHTDKHTNLLQFHVPVVEGDRPDLGYVYTKAAMNSRAFNTEHDAKVDTRPLWLLSSTVSTLIVTRDIKEVKTKGITTGAKGGKKDERLINRGSQEGGECSL